MYEGTRVDEAFYYRVYGLRVARAEWFKHYVLPILLAHWSIEMKADHFKRVWNLWS